VHPTTRPLLRLWPEVLQEVAFRASLSYLAAEPVAIFKTINGLLVWRLYQMRQKKVND